MGSCFKVNEAATVSPLSLNLSQICNDNFQDPVIHLQVALSQKQLKEMASRWLQFYIFTACYYNALDMGGKL
jgi:hypothetical protein